jgi:hypothetical protein
LSLYSSSSVTPAQFAERAPMRNQWNRAIVTMVVLLCGCSHPADPKGRGPDLKLMASALEQPWPGAKPLTLTMTVQHTADRPVLHCRLTNVGDKPIRLDRSGLPWKQPIYFRGTVVAEAGTTSHLFVTVLSYLRGGPQLFDLAPNETIEGDFEPRFLPGSPLTGESTPRARDTLLLWSYPLVFTEAPSSGREELVGATFLP